MSAAGGRSGRPRTHALMAIDALAYGVVVTAGTLVLALVVGVATGGGLVRAKLLLFLAGWLLMGVATVRLWPTSPAEVGDDGTAGRPGRVRTAEPTRIEAVAAALPPLRWMEPSPRQLSPPLKLFVGSLLVLGASLLLEVVFAVE